MSNIIFIKGPIETLNYFGGKLSDTFIELGFTVSTIDFLNELNHGRIAPFLLNVSSLLSQYNEDSILVYFY